MPLGSHTQANNSGSGGDGSGNGDDGGSNSSRRRRRRGSRAMPVATVIETPHSYHHSV